MNRRYSEFNLSPNGSLLRRFVLFDALSYSTLRHIYEFFNALVVPICFPIPLFHPLPFHLFVRLGNFFLPLEPIQSFAFASNTRTLPLYKLLKGHFEPSYHL